MTKQQTVRWSELQKNHRKKVGMSNSRRVLVRMEPALYRKVKRLAAESQTSLQAVLMTAVRDLIN